MTEDKANIADLFRLAARNVANSVAIISAGDAVGGTAMTATAVSTVSMSPPSLLICVNRSASIYPILLRGAGFSVNYLASEQEDLARFCSDKSTASRRLEHPSFMTNSGELAPVVWDAVACLLCKQDGRYLYGSHAIFIGQVIDVCVGASRSPLIYTDGQYQGLQRDLDI